MQGNENLGMAMTFTLVSHLREALSKFVENRLKIRMAQEHEKERLAIEVGCVTCVDQCSRLI